MTKKEKKETAGNLLSDVSHMHLTAKVKHIINGKTQGLNCNETKPRKEGLNYLETTL